MRESGYYPPGAEFDGNAPYNERTLPEIEIELTVSVCMSRTVWCKTTDYMLDSDGNPTFEESDLEKIYFDNYKDPVDIINNVSPNEPHWEKDEFEVL